MPSISNTMTSARLAVFMRGCFMTRKPPDKFTALLIYAQQKWRFTSKQIVVSLINCIFDLCTPKDPLVRLYVQTTITQHHAQLAEFLAALIYHWHLQVKSGHDNLSKYWECLAFTVSSIAGSIGAVSIEEDEIRACMIISSRWMIKLYRIVRDNHVTLEDFHVNAVNEAVAGLLFALMSTNTGHNLLASEDTSKTQDLTDALDETIGLSMEFSANISMRLIDITQRYPNLFATQRNGKTEDRDPTVMAISLQDNVATLPIIPTRIATSMLLYNLLISASTIDDTALCALLDSRHSGNYTIVYSELTHASFEALAKASESQEESYKRQGKIFLLNKLPAILAYILQLATFESLPAEQLLINLWNDLAATSDQYIMSIAKHFLHVCVLHHLMSSETVENMTSESAETSTAKGLFLRESLIEQVTMNAARGPRLVDELQRNDGNAGTISFAVLEVMHRYCASRETGHLKDMAIAFLRKPETLNVVAMWITPSYWLAPICRLLDDWSFEDNNGESQPVYEEFGCILLFVIIVTRKLGLRIDQVGLASNHGFVARYLSSEGTARGYSQMSAEEQNHIGDWIEALFFSDGGLTDELFGACNPKDFYLLVPSLLYQATSAYKAGKLPEESLKNNLEYLLEPSLIPSLLTAFSWLGRIAEKSPKEATLIAQILTKTPGNSETLELHRTIVAASQHEVNRQISQTADMNQLSDFRSFFATQLDFMVQGEYSAEDLHLWQSADGGILQYLEKFISEMLLLRTNTLLPRNLLQAAIKTCGSHDVLHSLVTLLIQYSTSEEFGQALDLVSVIIAFTNTEEISLKTALQLQQARIGQYLKKGDGLYAEALVHLSRRVQLYTTAFIPQNLNIEATVHPLDGGEMTKFNLDEPPMSDAGAAQQSMPAMPQDTDMVDQTINDILNDTGNIAVVDDMNDFDFDLDNPDNYELGDLNEFDLNMF